MRRIFLVLLVAGCNEHGSSVPDASIPDATPAFDAFEDMCVSADGTARVTVAPSASFGRLYAGGVFGAGLFAPAEGYPVTLMFLISNQASADFDLLACQTSNCPTDGLFVVTENFRSDAVAGSHPVTITRTTGGGPAVQGNVTITSFDDPTVSLTGFIAATISASTPSITGSFSSAFCPSFMSGPI